MSQDMIFHPIFCIPTKIELCEQKSRMSEVES